MTQPWLEETISERMKKLADVELSQFLDLTNGTTFGFKIRTMEDFHEYHLELA